MKLQYPEDMASSTTSINTISNIPLPKVRTTNSSIVVADVNEDACSSSSINANFEMIPNTSQNYQHLVGILSTPPIIHNSSLAAAAAAVAVATSHQNLSDENQIHHQYPSLTQQQDHILPWNRHHCFSAGKKTAY